MTYSALKDPEKESFISGLDINERLLKELQELCGEAGGNIRSPSLCPVPHRN